MVMLLLVTASAPLLLVPLLLLFLLLLMQLLFLLLLLLLLLVVVMALWLWLLLLLLGARASAAAGCGAISGLACAETRVLALLMRNGICVFVSHWCLRCFLNKNMLSFRAALYTKYLSCPFRIGFLRCGPRTSGQHCADPRLFAHASLDFLFTRKVTMAMTIPTVITMTMTMLLLVARSVTLLLRRHQYKKLALSGLSKQNNCKNQRTTRAKRYSRHFRKSHSQKREHNSRFLGS